MNYIQKGHLDDKIVSQLLQIHQTFFVTCDFLRFAFFFDLSSAMTNQTQVFEEIEGKANDKNKVLEQTPVVLLEKYMDLLRLDDSNLGEHLERIKYIISCMVNTRNCDYVFEHTSLLQKIQDIPGGNSRKQGFALLKLFRSSTARKTIVNHPGLLDELINLVYCPSYMQNHDIDIVRSLCGLIYETRDVAMKMLESPLGPILKLLDSISTKLFPNVDSAKLNDLNHEIYFQELLNLVGILARAVSQIDVNTNRSVFAFAPGILERLLSFRNASLTTEQQKSTIKALTLIHHAQDRAFTRVLTSPYLFEARGEANLILGLHKEALADFETAFDYYENDKWKQKTCILRCVFCKVKLEDYAGALHDADNVVTNFEKSTFTLQERGVVKEMMQDYQGAIEDLTEALLRCEGGPQYECLKHRAYAHFKLGLETEAHQDAKMANQLGVRDDVEESIARGMMSLSILPVPEFLGYKLT
jgi:tetratricopeptide (TPR) repeat protein